MSYLAGNRILDMLGQKDLELWVGGRHLRLAAVEFCSSSKTGWDVL